MTKLPLRVPCGGCFYIIRFVAAARIHKRNMMNYKRMAHAPIWAFFEIIWYIKWWGNLFYRLGEWILDTSARLIDFHDELWDEIEKKVKREENVLV